MGNHRGNPNTKPGSGSYQGFGKVAFVLKYEGDGVFHEKVLAVVGCFLVYKSLKRGDRLIE